MPSRLEGAQLQPALGSAACVKGAILPAAYRVCLACNTGEVGGEVHHVWKCSAMEEPRSQLLATLYGLYPGLSQEITDIRHDEGRVCMLLWTIPDGRYMDGPYSQTSRAETRVKATRAVIGFLHATHTTHPTLKRRYAPWT